MRMNKKVFFLCSNLRTVNTEHRVAFRGILVDTGALNSSGQKVFFPECFTGILLGFFLVFFLFFSSKKLKTFNWDAGRAEGSSSEISVGSLPAFSLLPEQVSMSKLHMLW